MSERSNALVVGGGMAALTAAHFLEKAGADIDTMGPNHRPIGLTRRP
jgi:protoporphyrinogen oxidase